MRWLALHTRVGLGMLGIGAAAASAALMPQRHDVPAGPVERAPSSGGADRGGVLLSVTKMIIEFNATADDVGMQLSIDGEPWRRLVGFKPDGRKLLDIRSQDSLALQGLTELFFESSEPSLSDLSLDEFLARFPAGEYEFEGRTIEGQPIEGVANFGHVIPAGPEVVSPPQSDTPPVIDPEDFVISWNPVVTTIDGSPSLVVVGYQVIVQQVTPKRTFSIDLPGTATSIAIPPEFFAQRDTLHKFEILAVEASGNQTITEGEFITAP